jgi:hypothetical protein
MRQRMRGTLVLTLAVAVILSMGAAAGAATRTPASLVSGGDGPLIQRVTNVCGANGCARVQTQRVQHHKPGSVAAKHI